METKFTKYDIKVTGHDDNKSMKRSSLFQGYTKKKDSVKITKLLVHFTRKNVYLLWLQNSGNIYSVIITLLNVAGKCSKSSFKIRH